MYTTIPAQHFISSSLLFIKIIFLFLSSYLCHYSFFFFFCSMTSIFTISISHFCHSVFSLSSPLLLLLFFLFLVGRLRGSWVAQLVGLAMGFGGFLIRFTVVSGGCCWVPADVAGYSGGDCERITGL